MFDFSKIYSFFDALSNHEHKKRKKNCEATDNRKKVSAIVYADSPAIVQGPAKDKKEAAGEMRGNPVASRRGQKWRREWELNPPEPVLQTVALAARPSRHQCNERIYYIPMSEKNQARNRFFSEKPDGAARGANNDAGKTIRSNPSPAFFMTGQVQNGFRCSASAPHSYNLLARNAKKDPAPLPAGRRIIPGIFRPGRRIGQRTVFFRISS